MGRCFASKEDTLSKSVFTHVKLNMLAWRTNQMSNGQRHSPGNGYSQNPQQIKSRKCWEDKVTLKGNIDWGQAHRDNSELNQPELLPLYLFMKDRRDFLLLFLSGLVLSHAVNSELYSSDFCCRDYFPACSPTSLKEGNHKQALKGEVTGVRSDGCSYFFNSWIKQR